MARKRLCFMVFFLVSVVSAETNSYLANKINGNVKQSPAPLSSPVTMNINEFPIKLKCEVSVNDSKCKSEQENSLSTVNQLETTSKILNSIRCDLSNIDIIEGFKLIENRVSAEFCSKIKSCALREPNFNQGLECVVKNNLIESIMSSNQANEIAKASLVTNLFKDDDVVSISIIQEELKRNFKISENLSCEAVKKESETKCQKEEIKSLLSIINDNEYINDFLKSDLLKKQKIDENNFLTIVHDYNKSKTLDPLNDPSTVEIAKTLNFLSQNGLKESEIEKYFNKLNNSKRFL